MDTNLIAEILRQAAGGSSTSGMNLNLLLIGIAAIAPTLVALAAYLQAKAAKVMVESNEVTLEKVHTAVNSERTAMLDVIKKLREELSDVIRVAAIAKTEAVEKPMTEARIIELIRQNKT